MRIETLHFDWKLVRHILSLICVGYKSARDLAALILMLLYTVFNLANPYLIGRGHRSFITRQDLHGLGVMSAIVCWLSTWLCGRRSTGRCGRCRGPGSRFFTI